MDTDPISVSDADVYEAMKDVGGYLDVTPADLREIYLHAFRHALDRIRQSLKAQDIMTQPVYSVKAETPLQEVAALMAEKGIAGLPVLDDEGRVAGVISEKDFLKFMGNKAHVMDIIAVCLSGKGCTAAPLRKMSAKDIMTAPAITVSEETTVHEIMGMFEAKDINRVPVVDESWKLAGIVSRDDIIRARVTALK